MHLDKQSNAHTEVPGRTNDRPSGNIEFSHVSFSHPGADRNIYSDLSLRITANEFVAVAGPSGCGKSTLLRLISGLAAIHQGTIRIDDVEAAMVRDTVAMVFQQDTLLPWRTAIANATFGLEGHVSHAEARERAMDALQAVGLEAHASKYPHQLSGGMRQRVNLARALTVDPAVLLMDEPFAALDAQTREQQQEHLLQVWKSYQKTVVFVTHDVDEAILLADRVIVMSAGPPSTVTAEYLVPLERPRQASLRTSHDFQEMAQLIRHALVTSHIDTTDSQETSRNEHSA